MNPQRMRTLIIIGSVWLLIGVISIANTSRPTITTPTIDTFSPGHFSDSSLPEPDFRCNETKVVNGLAQCGTQASSCKNCHEVKGEDPVNANGDWHIQHAFGDFCEFCHGGNVQAPEKDAAHQGLIAPLDDVKTNCSACHDDYQTLAQPYASALGVTIGISDGGSNQPPSDASTPSEPAPTPQPAPENQVAVPASSEIVDYVAQYQSGGTPTISAGNAIVGGLLIVTLLGGGAFIYFNERRLRSADGRLPITDRGRLIVNGATAQPEIANPKSEFSIESTPELAKLLPTLQSVDPRTLRALKVILSDRKRGEELLQSLSLINFAVLDEMKRLDKQELSLLLALANES